jgi:hypothetical protein
MKESTWANRTQTEKGKLQVRERWYGEKDMFYDDKLEKRE